MSFLYFLFVIFCDLIIIVITQETIQGWIYADNWFELYFNGKKVATDPILFKPHNAVKINFEAPGNGVYNYAFWAQDYADDITGLEYDDTCLGDGGIRISLSDGTVSNSSWKCYIYMEGPTNPNECGLFDKDCTENGKACIVQYNTLPECWNMTTCDTSTTGWVSATEYTEDRVGWGSPPNPNDCGDPAVYPNGCKPQDVNWLEYGASSFIWTGDLDYHNRIVCRYSYVASTPSPVMAPTQSPLLEGQTRSPTNIPSNIPSNLPSNVPSKAPISSNNSDGNDTTNDNEIKKKHTRKIIIQLIAIGIALIIIGLSLFICIRNYSKKNKNATNSDFGFALLNDDQMDGNPTTSDDHL